jgi:hypothetical protein
MLDARYSPPANVRIEGRASDFDEVRAQLHDLLASAGHETRIATISEGDPAPYQTRLLSIRFTRATGPTRVSISLGQELVVAGSDQNLGLFSSWLDFERATPPTHQHYEYYPGNQWVAPDSLPLVISLR